MQISSINITPLSLNWNYKTGSCATLLLALGSIGLIAGVFALLGTNNLAFMANFPSLGTSGSIALLGGGGATLALGIIWSLSLLHNRHKKTKILAAAPPPPPYNSASLAQQSIAPPSAERDLYSSLLPNSPTSITEEVIPTTSSSETPLLASDDLEVFLEAIKTALLDTGSLEWITQKYHALLMRCGVVPVSFRKNLIEKNELTPEGIENSEEWKKVRQKFTKLFAQTAEFVTKSSQLEWIHGTRSPTLIGIDRVAQNSFSEEKYLLVPTGILLNNNIVPLTGELESGISSSGINQDRLSWVSACQTQTAVEYSDQIAFLFTPENERKIIENFINDPFIQTVRLKIAVLRLLSCPSKSFQDERMWIINELEKIITAATSPPPNCQKFIDSEKIVELRQLCDDLQPWTLNEKEKKLLEDSFPILWGASKIANERVKYLMSKIPGESAILGSLALGENVNSAFTKKKELQRLKEWLEKRSLSVYPMTISAAYFLAAFAHFQQQKAKA